MSDPTGSTGPTFPGGTGPTIPPDSPPPFIDDLRTLLKHPDMLNRAVTKYVVSELVTLAVEKGTGDLVDLPLKTDSQLTKDDKSNDGTFEVCHHHAISAFGHEVISWDDCVSGSGTGSGHGTITVGSEVGIVPR